MFRFEWDGGRTRYKKYLYLFICVGLGPPPEKKNKDMKGSIASVIHQISFSPYFFSTERKATTGMGESDSQRGPHFIFSFQTMHI